MGITEEEKASIRQRNSQFFAEKGFSPLPTLPMISGRGLRPIEEIKGRMSVMNALINIAFEAPIEYISEWIYKHDLANHLSPTERELLSTDLSEVSDEDINALTWYMEGLYTLMWVTKIADHLDENAHMDEELAAKLPNLAEAETNQKLSSLQHIQSDEDTYHMLDYYSHLLLYQNSGLHPSDIALDEGSLYERCKALTWVLHAEMEWDEVNVAITLNNQS